jgi:hypothetical protein
MAAVRTSVMGTTLSLVSRNCISVDHREICKVTEFLFLKDIDKMTGVLESACSFHFVTVTGLWI